MLFFFRLPKYEGQSHNELSSKRAREQQAHREEPPSKRFRGNDSRPYYNRNHSNHSNHNNHNDNYNRRPRDPPPSGGRYRGEYVPRRRYNSQNYNDRSRNSSGRRYPSRERQDPPPTLPTQHEAPRDYREQGLGADSKP